MGKFDSYLTINHEKQTIDFQIESVIHNEGSVIYRQVYTISSGGRN